jgi:glycosyltransferase involved in cell wall biosynthesis
VKTVYLVIQKYKYGEGSSSGVYTGFADSFSKSGYNVEVLCCKDKDQLTEENMDKVKIKRFSTPAWNLPFFGGVLNYILLSFHVLFYLRKKAKRGDIFIANGLSALGVINKPYILRIGLPAKSFNKNMNIAKTYLGFFSRINMGGRFLLQGVLEKICFRNAMAYLAPSKEILSLHYKLYGTNNRPYFIPYTDIDAVFFQNRKKEPHKFIKMLVVCAGGNEKILKGIVYLEECVPDLMKKYPSLLIMHAGEKFKWKVPEWCNKQIVQYGKVNWKKMSGLYSEADFLVSTTLKEGFPHMILESMASGLPIVTSDIEGISEYIEHMKSGYIFKRGNVEELKKGVSYFIDHKKEAAEMGKHAKRKIACLKYEIYIKKVVCFVESVYLGKKENVNLLNNLC